MDLIKPDGEARVRQNEPSLGIKRDLGRAEY